MIRFYPSLYQPPLITNNYLCVIITAGVLLPVNFASSFAQGFAFAFDTAQDMATTIFTEALEAQKCA